MSAYAESLLEGTLLERSIRRGLLTGRPRAIRTEIDRRNNFHRWSNDLGSPFEAHNCYRQNDEDQATLE